MIAQFEHGHLKGGWMFGAADISDLTTFPWLADMQGINKHSLLC